jgi:two-component system sensor histidine kinase CpxA
MRGLFFKIFAIFWLAQSLIYVISTALIVSQRFPNHNSVGDALDSHLRNDSRIAMNAFERGGCSGFTSDMSRNEPSGGALLDANGSLLCSTANAISLDGVRPHSRERIDGRALDKSYVWFVRVRAQSMSTSGFSRLRQRGRQHHGTTFCISPFRKFR